MTSTPIKPDDLSERFADASRHPEWMTYSDTLVISWPKDPEKDATFVENGRWWASGDTYLVYPKAEPSLRFLELRNGIVAAEKARILQENGLGAGFDNISKLFNRKDAMAGKSDFNKIKSAFQSFVNGKR